MINNDGVKKVRAFVKKSAYQELRKEVPDLFFNPNIIVDIVKDEYFDKMIEERQHESSKS